MKKMATGPAFITATTFTTLVDSWPRSCLHSIGLAPRNNKPTLTPLSSDCLRHTVHGRWIGVYRAPRAAGWIRSRRRAERLWVAWVLLPRQTQDYWMAVAWGGTPARPQAGSQAPQFCILYTNPSRIYGTTRARFPAISPHLYIFDMLSFQQKTNHKGSS